VIRGKLTPGVGGERKGQHYCQGRDVFFSNWSAGICFSMRREAG